MFHGQKQKTSVFSQYENNENDSITSRQLQFWLKQTAPVNLPKIQNEWTLMSTNSIYEQDEHVLQRNPTFQTINKENDSYTYNSQRQNQNTSAVMKSKSYINAMADLQSKVKQLEQQNMGLKNSLKFIKEDRSRSMSQSSVANEQLKQRLAMLEPKAKKLQEFVRQNKKLRDWRQQNMKKTKIMEKMIKQYGQKFVQYQRQIARMKDNSKEQSKAGEQTTVRYKELQKIIQKLKNENNKLSEKNKVLQDMKERATTSVLEKYSRSVNQIQLLTIQTDNLKKQLSFLNIQNEERLKNKQDQSRRSKEQLINSYQRLKQQNIEKKEMISTLKTEVSYFKQNYQKVREELMNSIKKHSKEIEQAKQREMSLKIQFQVQKQKIIEMQKQRLKQIQQQKKKQIVYIPQQQQIYLSKQSIINSQANNKNQIQSQLQFQQPQQLQSIPFYETRSAIDKQSDIHINQRTQNNKQLDTLSQENCRQNIYIEGTKTKQANFNNAALKKLNSINKRQQTKQKTQQKLKQRSQQKIRSKQKSREKSRQKSRDIQRNQALSNQHSFILKSHEPLTHKEEPQYLYYTEQPNNHSANNRKNIPYYWDSNEVADFGLSQRGNRQNYNNNCHQNPFTSQFKLEQALLNEINREAVRLIEEQQRLVLSFGEENLTPNERAEHNGRMKQLNEQIRANHQKRLEIKQRMSDA